jgi:serine/threonine protein kinase
VCFNILFIVSSQAIREIRILKSLKHENIIALKEIIVYKDEDENEEHSSSDLFGEGGLVKGDIFMVFEYCFGDLSGLLKTKEVVSHVVHLHE